MSDSTHSVFTSSVPASGGRRSAARSALGRTRARLLRSLALSLALLPLLVAVAPAAATQLLRVLPENKSDYLRLLHAAPEARSCGATVVGDAVEFAADADRADALRALGFDVEVAVSDLEAFYASRIHTRDDFGLYHTYTEAIQAMDALVAAYPNLIAPKQSIGQTIEGREIWVYKISDNPGIDEDEPEIYFNAYIHSREAITFEVVHDLATHLLNGYGLDPRATEIVDTREIWIQPAVNPDGVEYNRQIAPGGGGMWRKNRRNNGDGTWGVDLNRNFGHEWGYDNGGSSPYGSSETYRGTAPFSEPETQAVRNFVLSRPISIALNYHSYSNLNLFAWGYDVLHPESYDEIFALGRVRRLTSGYNTGTTWEILYPTNGDANDWMMGDADFFSFVTEVGTSGDGFWPAEGRIPTLVGENREANLRCCELADEPLRAMPPMWPLAAAPDSVPSSFTLYWSTPLPDPANPPVSWNLIEGTGHSVGADNLESNVASRWVADGWAIRTNRSHSAPSSYYGGNANNLNNVLISRRGHRVAPGEQLRFWTWYSTENQWDYGYVEVATTEDDYRAIPGSITTNSDPNDRNLGNGITGNSGGWIQATFDLSAYAGEVVWVRFRYNTDGYSTGEGWYVDDIQPTDLFATETVVATGLTQSQYAFSGHDEGTFSYIVQAVDGEGDVSAWGPPETVYVGASTSVGDPGIAAWRGLEVVGRHPFRSQAGLRFAVPSGARDGQGVRLTVHDVSGREVATLLSTEIGAGGAVPGAVLEAQWRPEGATAGLYFARLVVGAEESREKLVFLP